MSKTFQVTVSDKSFEAIQKLMNITGHERPGALFALMVRRYGNDLARCLSDYVPSTPDVAPFTPTHIVPTKTDIAPPAQSSVLPTPDYVASTPDIVLPTQEGLSLKDKMRLLSKPNQQ